MNLNSAVNARIAQPSEAIILINDTLNDSQLALFCNDSVVFKINSFINSDFKSVK